MSNPLPKYNQKVWDNQVSMLPIALTQEEIKDVYSLSNKIDKIEKSYSKLTELVSKLPINQLNQYHPTINENNEEESIRNIITSKELKPQIQKVLDEFKKLIQEVTETKKSWWS